MKRPYKTPTVPEKAEQNDTWYFRKKTDAEVMECPSFDECISPSGMGVGAIEDEARAGERRKEVTKKERIAQLEEEVAKLKREVAGLLAREHIIIHTYPSISPTEPYWQRPGYPGGPPVITCTC